ncbi:hypothetical protein D3C83_119500 [compost metagenome]
MWKSRWPRSCEPFCWGEAGRMNSTATPWLIHHTLSCESLPSAIEANGVPLSTRITLGKPWWRISLRNTRSVPLNCWLGRARHAR